MMLLAVVIEWFYCHGFLLGGAGSVGCAAMARSGGSCGTLLLFWFWIIMLLWLSCWLLFLLVVAAAMALDHEDVLRS